MYLAELRVENFRMFGEGDKGISVPLHPRITALVGENDAGKTALIDALRLLLGTRDQEFMRVEDSDFHDPADGAPRRTEIVIRGRFVELSPGNEGAFAEYLTYDDPAGAATPVLYVTWRARVMQATGSHRRVITVEVRSGRSGDGPQLDAGARQLLSAAYLRPLRDADRALSAGRTSRLAQILQHTKEVRELGSDFDPNSNVPLDPTSLSVLGIGDLANDLLVRHQGLQRARTRLNTDYLKKLSFVGDELQGNISVSTSKDPDTRRRQLLEKLDLVLHDTGRAAPPPSRGLGSNNLLFLACELLLLGSEEDSLPILLVEEPEAHLHPQRQLRLMEFLKEKVDTPRDDGQNIQIVMTSHSPQLASAFALNTVVLVHRGCAFSMAPDHTNLDQSDYGFLQRFLDVTKANLFFARGVLIVEGDAENILLPTLATLLGRGLTASGVSIVNVGGVGLRRFARIFQRRHPDKGTINTPVACLTDFDVMPDCAPAIVGKVGPSDPLPEKTKRRWRVQSDYTSAELADRRRELSDRASGQRVKTFVSDHWTLEYDLAVTGLAREVWIAAQLAAHDDAICAGRNSCIAVAKDAALAYRELARHNTSPEVLATHVYAVLEAGRASKATAAQYLASLLQAKHSRGLIDAVSLRSKLPSYLIEAIDYVTGAAQEHEERPDGSQL